RPDRVGDEDIVEACCSEDLGLTNVSCGDSDSSRLDLAPADLHTFVRLDVRPDVEVMLGGEALHAIDIVLHHVDQNDRRRGANSPDEGVECSLNTVHACSPHEFAATTSVR